MFLNDINYQHDDFFSEDLSKCWKSLQLIASKHNVNSKEYDYWRTFFITRIDEYNQNLNKKAIVVLMKSDKDTFGIKLRVEQHGNKWQIYQLHREFYQLRPQRKNDFYFENNNWINIHETLRWTFENEPIFKVKKSKENKCFSSPEPSIMKYFDNLRDSTNIWQYVVSLEDFKSEGVPKMLQLLSKSKPRNQKDSLKLIEVKNTLDYKPEEYYKKSIQEPILRMIHELRSGNIDILNIHEIEFSVSDFDNQLYTPNICSEAILTFNKIPVSETNFEAMRFSLLWIRNEWKIVYQQEFLYEVNHYKN